MKHIAFSALPPDERAALMEALQRSGIAPHQVCVSRLEPATTGEGDTPPCMALVSAPGWFRMYEAGCGRVVLVEEDLGQGRAGDAA